MLDKVFNNQNKHCDSTDANMVSSLRHTVYKNFGKISYLHYFRRMIKDFETGKWDFDIRSIVKNIKVEIPW